MNRVQFQSKFGADQITLQWWTL